MTLYTVTNLSVAMGGRALVQDISFRIAPSECVALVGESGSGKSLSSFAPFGLIDGAKCTGNALLGDVELIGCSESALREARSQNVGFVFQQPLNALTPHLTVAQHLREAAGARDESALAAMLAEVDLSPELLHRYPHQLSGGQRQRVMIAMAVARGPKLLIADEPTAALDSALRDDIMALLDRLRAAQGLGVLLVSHDLASVAAHADRVIILRNGRVVEAGDAWTVLTAPKSDYARALIGLGTPSNAPPPKSQTETLLAASNISVSYPNSSWRGGRTMAVDHCSLTIARGEAVAIVGGSGSGKSTLARAIAGLGPYDSGDISWQGMPLPPRLRRTRAHRRLIQPVFQDPQASLDPMWRVADCIAEPLRAFRPELSADARHARVLAALESVELDPALATRRAHQLSGGQAQRVALARALIAEPALLLLDEATSALDALTTAAIVDLLSTLRRSQGLSLLVITHDEALARTLCDRTLVMHGGRLSAP